MKRAGRLVAAAVLAAVGGIRCGPKDGVTATPGETAAATAGGDPGAGSGTGGGSGAETGPGVGSASASDVGPCVSIEAPRTLLSAANEAAAVDLEGGIAIGALAPAGASVLLDDGHEDGPEGDHGGHAGHGDKKAAAAPAVVPKTQILLGVGRDGKLPAALVAVAETSFAPRGLTLHRHAAGVALAWLEPPGLMLLRAGVDGLPVGEPKLVARNATAYALAWGRGGFVLVARDPEGNFRAVLGPDGATRVEAERFAGGSDAIAAVAEAAGIPATKTSAALSALLPPGAATKAPVAAVRAAKGKLGFVWLEEAGTALSAAVAECP